MKQWGLSEADALDMYHHSSMVKNNKLVRKHNGYEVGIWFFAASGFVEGEVSQLVTLLANSWVQHCLSLLRWKERNGSCEARLREQE